MRIEAFLKESPLFAVTSAARRLEGLTAQVLEGDNLSFLEALVLAALFFEAPQPVRPSSLAETFGTTRSHVSHCVSSLEAKGLLRRNIDPDDGRAYRLTLKPQGKRTAVRVIGAFDRLQRAFERDAGHPALRAMFKTLLQVEDAFRIMISKPRIE
jgi:DNA-binding MarR family transcriptional regulator